MRSHLLIWFIVALLAVLAAIVGYMRSGASTQARLPHADVLVKQALLLMEDDPKAFDRATQATIRAAAVLAESGELVSPEGYYLLGVQYVREQDLQAAEEQYRRAIAGKEDWAQPHAALGDLIGRHTIGREEEAEEELLRAIELDPEWALPHDVLAVLYRHRGELEFAERSAKRALQLAPDDVAVQNNYANLMFQQGRYDEAERHYLRAIDANPLHAKPYYNLACFYSLIGRTDDALDKLALALERAPLLQSEAAMDEDLTPLREEPRFEALVYGPAEPPELEQE